LLKVKGWASNYDIIIVSTLTTLVALVLVRILLNDMTPRCRVFDLGS
jgi:hypothetical protein